MIIRVLAYAAMLCVLGCRPEPPLVGPPLVLSADDPRHPCARSGVSTCENECQHNGDGQACLVASIAHARNGPSDRELMMAYELRACELGVGQGCEYYAQNFSLEEEAEVRVASEYYERACRAGRLSGCVTLGSIALRIDATGKPTDPRTAELRFREACDMNDAKACAQLADLWILGIGTETKEMARSRYEEACIHNHANSCHNARNDDERRLSIPVNTVFELVHSPDPVVPPMDMPPGWRAPVKVRLCLDPEPSAPVRVKLVESSGVPQIDTLVVETLEGWRLQRRPWLTVEGTICADFHFVFASPSAS